MMMRAAVLSIAQQVISMIVSRNSLGHQKFIVKKLLADAAVILGIVVFMAVLIAATLMLLMMASYQFMLSQGMTEMVALLTLTGSSLALIIIAAFVLLKRVKIVNRLTDAIGSSADHSTSANSNNPFVSSLPLPDSVIEVGRSFMDGLMGRDDIKKSRNASN